MALPMLKATATQDTDGDGPPIISRAWKVVKQQRGLYTGGKVELLPPGAGPKGEDVVASMYGTDVVLSDARNGQVLKVVSCGEGEGKEEIVTFAVHPKGHELATASRNLMVRFWDWRSGEQPRCTRAFKAHETPVLSMAYDGTGTLLATGGSDRTVKVWDVPGGFCTHNLRGHAGIVTLVQFHPDPRRELLLTASDDCTVRVWGLAVARGGGEEEEDGDGQGRKKKKKKKEAKGGKEQGERADPCLHVLTNHMSAVTGLGVSRDGATLVTAGRDQVVSLWALEGGGCALLESVPVYEVVEGLVLLDAAEARRLGQGRWDGAEFGGRPSAAEEDALHRDRHRKRPRPDQQQQAGGSSGQQREGAFVLAGAKGAVRVFHYKPKADPFAKGLAVRCVAEQRGAEAYPRGYSGVLRGHGRRLLAVTTDHNLHWLDGGSLRRERVLVGYNDQIIDVRYLGQDGRRVAVASNSPQVRVFGLADLGCEGVLEGQHTETVLTLDASPDGRWVVTGAKDRSVCLWRIDERRQQQQPHEEAEEEEGGEGQGGASQMLATACVARFEGHTDAVTTVALTRRKAGYQPGGQAVVFSAGLDRTLKRWALSTLLRPRQGDGGGEEGEEEAEAVKVTEATASVLAHDKDVNVLAVAPNDALVASASQDKTVKLWDAKKLTPVGVLRGHKRGVWSVEFSPIDRCVVTGSADRTVRIWSLADFSCLKSLEGHSASVLRATFLRSGLQVLSAGSDGLVKLWTARTQECDATLDGHEERVWALALSPGGTQAVTGGGDSVLNVWEDVTAREEEEALRAAEALVEKEQALMNAAHRRDYHQAVKLALELGRPFRLLKILQDILEAGTNAQSPIEALDPYVRTWSDADIGQILGYAREWNTNAKNAPVAQALLQSFLRLLPHARLKRCCASQPGVLHGLLAYTERHLARADRLLQASFLADYTLSSMQLLFPEEDAAAEARVGPDGALAAGGGGGSAGLLMNGRASATAANGAANGTKAPPAPRPGGYGSSSSEDEEEESEAERMEEGSEGEEEEPVPAAAASKKGKNKKQPAAAAKAKRAANKAAPAEADADADEEEEEEQQQQQPAAAAAGRPAGRKGKAVAGPAAEEEEAAKKGGGGKSKSKGKKAQAKEKDEPAVAAAAEEEATAAPASRARSKSSGGSKSKAKAKAKEEEEEAAAAPASAKASSKKAAAAAPQGSPPRRSLRTRAKA